MATGLMQAKQAIDIVQQAVLTQSVIRASGSGKAYQSVAQSGAIAIQDATDYLRNILTICTTATGVAMAKIASGDPNGVPLLQQAQSCATQAAATFMTIGQNAATVVTGFPTS